MDKNGNYLKWDQVHQRLLNENLKLFSLHDFQVLFGTDKQTAIKFLSRHKKRGNLSKLRRCLYSLATNPPSLYLSANRIYRPSYISFETALSFYGLIPEVVYSFTSATPKTSQEFVALGNTFIYHSIKKEAFNGYLPQEIEGNIILMAEPEKALADYLYFVSLGKKKFNNRLFLNNLNQDKLKDYAAFFEHPSMLKLLKKP